MHYDREKMKLLGEQLTMLGIEDVNAKYPVYNKYRYDVIENTLADYGLAKTMCMPVLNVYKSYIRNRSPFTLPGFDFIFKQANCEPYIKGDLRIIPLTFDVLLDNQKEKKIEMSADIRQNMEEIRDGKDIIGHKKEDIAFVIKIGDYNYIITPRKIEQTQRQMGTYNIATNCLIEKPKMKIKESEIDVKHIQNSIVDKDIITLDQHLDSETNYLISEKKEGTKCYIYLSEEEMILLNSQREKEKTYDTIMEHGMSDTLVLANKNENEYVLLDIILFRGKDVKRSRMVDRMIALKAVEKCINEMALIKVSKQHYDHLITLGEDELNRLIDRDKKGLVFTPASDYHARNYEIMQSPSIDVRVLWMEDRYKGKVDSISFELDGIENKNNNDRQVVEMVVTRKHNTPEILLTYTKTRVGKKKPTKQKEIRRVLRVVSEGVFVMRNVRTIIARYQEVRIALSFIAGYESRMVTPYRPIKKRRWDMVLQKPQDQAYVIIKDDQRGYFRFPVTKIQYENLKLSQGNRRALLLKLVKNGHVRNVVTFTHKEMKLMLKKDKSSSKFRTSYLEEEGRIMGSDG